MKLIGIAFSHYVEKARWALDRYGVEYDDARYMPTFHFPAVVWSTRGRGGRSDRVSTRFSTPLLLLDDGRRLQDSSDIVRWASDTYGTPETTLYPAPEVAQFEAYVSAELGPHSRRAVYNQGLADPLLMRRIAERNVGPAQARLFGALFPLCRQAIVRGLRVTPEGAARSVVRARKVFDEVEARRAGGRFVLGDRFTAADLAFACMAAPLLMPSPEYGYAATLPALDECRPRRWRLSRGSARTLRASLRSTCFGASDGYVSPWRRLPRERPRSLAIVGQESSAVAQFRALSCTRRAVTARIRRNFQRTGRRSDGTDLRRERVQCPWIRP